jgi:phosphoglycolate phosphatase
MNKLILWDIDGTLLYSGGVAGEAMRASMVRVYGSASTEARHSYAGKTDRQIILETFAEREHDDLISSIDHFTATYIEELTGRRDEFLARCRVLEGVVLALEHLTTADVIQSVLTQPPADREDQARPDGPDALPRSRYRRVWQRPPPPQ